MQRSFGGIGASQQNLIVAFHKKAGDIKTERQKAAPMVADLVAVDPQLASKIDCPKVQMHHFVHRMYHLKTAPVPDFFIRLQHMFHARKPGFRCERHQNMFLKTFRLRSLQIQNGKIPPAVQVLPVSTDHLRARVFRQGDRLIDLPGCGQVVVNYIRHLVPRSHCVFYQIE